MKAFGEYARAVTNLGPNAWRFLLFSTFSSVGWSMFNLNFNLYLYALGYKQDFIGILNGLPSLAILALGLPIGMMADRKGYVKFLIAGAVLTTLSSLGLALSVTRSALLLYSFLSGLAGAASWVVGAPFLMSISKPEERVYLFSVQSAIMMGTGFFGSLLAGAVPDYLAGRWGVSSTAVMPLRMALLINVLFALLGTLTLLGMKESKPGASATPGQRTTHPLPRTGKELVLFIKLLGPQAMVALGAGAMVTFFQLFFNLRFGMEPGKIGTVFAFSSVTTMLATLVAPLLSGRLGRVRTVVVTELLSIPFLLTLAYSANVGMVVSSYYLRTALMNMAGPIQQTFVLEQVDERQRATLTSLGAMLGSLGRGGIGPIISGYLQVVSGFSLAFTFTTICYVIGALLFWFFFRKADGAPPASLRVASKTSV